MSNIQYTIYNNIYILIIKKKLLILKKKIKFLNKKLINFKFYAPLIIA